MAKSSYFENTTTSEHPIAQLIVSAAQRKSLPLLLVTGVQAQAGLGIAGTLAGKKLTIGKRPLVDRQLITSIENELSQTSQRIEADGKTVIWVSYDERVMGLLAVAAQIRPVSPNLIGILKQLGIKTTVMLTSDNAATAQTIGQSAGVDQTVGEKCWIIGR